MLPLFNDPWSCTMSQDLLRNEFLLIWLLIRTLFWEMGTFLGNFSKLAEKTSFKKFQNSGFREIKQGRFKGGGALPPLTQTKLVTFQHKMCMYSLHFWLVWGYFSCFHMYCCMWISDEDLNLLFHKDIWSAWATHIEMKLILKMFE